MWKRPPASIATTARWSRGASAKAARPTSSPSGGGGGGGGISSAVDSIILRSLKEHYLEASRMTPPPVSGGHLKLVSFPSFCSVLCSSSAAQKVNPPAPFKIVQGALERQQGPVLQREYKEEEITVSVMRLANILPSGAGEEEDEDGDEGINQLFLHVDVSKPGREEALHFLCGLYPDAIGIHSVCLRPKVIGPGSLRKYSGRIFQELDQKMRDAFHIYVEERGLNESLFPFLQAWLYVKDHRNLMRWFKSVGTFVSEHQTTSTAISS